VSLPSGDWSRDKTNIPPGTAPRLPQMPTTAASQPGELTVRLPVHPVWATYVFLGIITLVFLGQLAGQYLLGADVIGFFGEKDNLLIAQGEYWRLFTAIFLHANILHYAFNAYALWVIGRDVERFSGPVRFTLIFILAGLSGSLFSLVFTPEPAVGASGAIFGLIGAQAVFLFRHRKLFGERGRRGLQSVIIIAVLNLAIGLQGGIDDWAHIGGLVGGLILTALLGPAWRVDRNVIQGGQPIIVDEQPMGGRQWLLALAFLVAVLVLSFAGAARYTF
jgi:rhomboid protease GluP